MSEPRFDWLPLLTSPRLQELAEELVEDVQKTFPRKSAQGASPAKRVAAYRQSSNQLISSLYAAWAAGDRVSFPVRPAAYHKSKFGKVRLSHQYTHEVYECLQARKWIAVTLGEEDYTRLSASGRLKAAFEDIGIRWMPQEPQRRDDLVVLRDISRDINGKPKRFGKHRQKKKYDCEVPETPEVNLWRNNLEYINSQLVKHCISLDLSNSNLDALKEELATKANNQEHYKRLYLHRVQLTRIFSRGSMSKGGRFYRGWWQSIPETHRPQIRIDGKKVIEIDYSGIALRIISVLCGCPLPPEVDPYDIGLPEWQGKNDPRRKPLKKIINALINDEDGDYKLFGTKKSLGVTPKALLQLFQKAHPSVFQRLADGVGLEAQFIDSQIAEAVMMKMLLDGIVCLPIHDSFLVPSGYTQVLSSVMKETFRDITGAEVSVDTDIVKTDQQFGWDKGDVLDQQSSDPEVGIVRGTETWDNLREERNRLTTKFLQSWYVWSGN